MHNLQIFALSKTSLIASSPRSDEERGHKGGWTLSPLPIDHRIHVFVVDIHTLRLVSCYH